MVVSALEREVKLQSAHTLDLSALGGEPLPHRSFVSTYVDTPDRLLGRCGITLRRRLEHGRNDWQLKLPSNGDRREIEAAGPPSGPPTSIIELLPAFLSHRDLVPLATLRTMRDGVLVRTDTGSAEVTLDDVAVLDGGQVTKTFAEVEIELVAGDERALRKIERAVTRLGARRSDGRTKIAQALGVKEPLAPRAKSDAERIRVYIAQRYFDLLAADPGVRLGADHEPVHHVRVATRRLRALLRAARPMLDHVWTESTREELDWLGSAFGPLRDLDVLEAHLREEAETLEQVDGRDLRDTFAALEADRSAARADALAVLESDRYLALLDAIASPPPLVESKETLESVAGAELKSLRKTMRKLDVAATDELVHKARVRAKRVRYVAEALGEKRVVSRAKQFQDVVGEHQDAVVAEERLRALAERVPESALELGILIERQRARRLRARAGVPKSWKKLERAAARAWT